MARIIIVEDESIEAMNLRNCLISMDHEVVYTASRGEEAVEKAIELEPDLILMDIVLKGMNGIEAAKTIKPLNIPVIYLTAYSDDNTLNKALAGEPYGYLLKPFDERKMKLAIEVALYKNKSEKKFKKRQETYYQTLFENSKTALGIIEENMVLSRINTEFIALTGFSREKIENKMKWTDFFSPEDQTNLKKFQQQQVIDPYSSHQNYEARLITKNKEFKDVFLNFAILPGTGQSTISLLDVSKLRKAETTAKESRKKYKGIFDNAAETILLFDRKGTILEANDKIEEISGFKKDELIGNNFIKLLPQVEIKYKEALRSFKDLITGKELKNVEWSIINKEGKEVHFLAHPSVIKEENKIKNIIMILEDITERKKAENQLKKSLAEKEVLIREIHHRVKNNLQVISSILSLQRMKVEDKEFAEILIECQGRVHSMALIHEKLYQSPDMSRISFDMYLEKLLADLHHNYINRKHPIQLKTQIENIELSIESAMPCGLIINELVSNSFKYAFPDNEGVISVELKEDPYHPEEYVLIVEDDGVGLPENINPQNTNKLGLKVVSLLVDQLHGKIELDRSKGTKFTIKFKDLKYQNRLTQLFKEL